MSRNDWKWKYVFMFHEISSAWQGLNICEMLRRIYFSRATSLQIRISSRLLLKNDIRTSRWMCCHGMCNTLQLRHNLKSPASPLFTQPCIQAQIKENIKAQRHWPLCGEFTVDRWIPAQMASNAENSSIWWRHHDLKGWSRVSSNLNAIKRSWSGS